MHYLQKKSFYVEKKSFILKNFLAEKNFFLQKKYINENVKTYILHLRNIFFMQKIFVLQIKYKFFLNIYSFCKKKIF